jgi:hypothetical protein
LRIFVMDTVRVGAVPGQLTDLFTEALLTAAAHHGGVEGHGMADLDALLSVERQSDLLGCEEVSCITEITGALGVGMVLRSSIGRAGDALSVHLSLLSRDGQGALARQEAVFASEAALIDAAPEMLRQLLAQVD